MVDLKAYFQDMNTPKEPMNFPILRSGAMGPPSRVKNLMFTEDCRPTFVDGTCAFCRDLKSEENRGEQQQVAMFEDYNFIAPEDEPVLDNHQYLLCPAEIQAFAFKTRVWGKLPLVPRGNITREATWLTQAAAQRRCISATYPTPSSRRT